MADGSGVSRVLACTVAGTGFCLPGSWFLVPDLCSLLRGPGGDLLSRVLRRSTIGAEGFHGRVRDGIGWGTLAMATRSSQQRRQEPGCRNQEGGRRWRADVVVLVPGAWFLTSDWRVCWRMGIG